MEGGGTGGRCRAVFVLPLGFRVGKILLQQKQLLHLQFQVQ